MRAHVSTRGTHTGERERERKMHNEIPISSPTCAVEERGREEEEGSGGRDGGREEERKGNFARG